MKKLLMLSALALVMTAGSAFAGPGEGGDGPRHMKKGPRHEKMLEKMFEKNDKDGDGTISLEEFQQSNEERFKAMDADGDGKVTKEEAKAHGEAMHKKWMENKDKRKEGFGQGGPDGAPPMDDGAPDGEGSAE
ncbi:MAG: EF-hand domain-containing protein [Rhodospirillales bacterium]|nr:EF-hand domain-containing protein [Alphaproteobacteria bacterium]MCB1840145.1 EF-hand domain-containing protein [Alphaproteobacteria bacterium]MCB9977892.1 EF-hand domain-containing protein [Rhodospirillales bacterium]